MHMHTYHIYIYIYICICICIHICLQRFVAPSDSERAAAVQLQSRVRGLRGRRISRERSADRLQLSSVTGVYDDCRRPTILYLLVTTARTMTAAARLYLLVVAIVP